MASPITNRQKTVLDFVKSTIKNRGEPPKIREIANELGLNSSGNVHRILVDLEKKGHINLRRTSTVIEIPRNRDGIPEGPLSLLQAKVYDYVVSRIGSGKEAPSLRMIRDELIRDPGLYGVSISGIHKALKRLEKDGRVVLSPKQSHSVALVLPDVSTQYAVVVHGVPCAASAFLKPIEGSARVISLPLAELMHRFVQVAIFGVELLDDRQLRQLSKGDYILFEKNTEPVPGNIVAFEYNGRITVRNFRSLKGSTVLLTSDAPNRRQENVGKQADDIETQREEIKFLGVGVAAIVRNIHAL